MLADRVLLHGPLADVANDPPDELELSVTATTFAAVVGLPLESWS
jgi:hypothetical protein